MVSTLVAVYCVSPRLGTTIKTNCMKVKTGVLTEIYLFFKKGSGTSFSRTFCAGFFKENISQLTRGYCLIFTSWDISKYMYSNCLLSSLWRHNFWILPWLSYQAIFLHDYRTKIWRSQERKELWQWNEKHFSSF